VEGNVSVDGDAFLVIDFVNKYLCVSDVLIEVRCAYVFIGLSACMCISIYNSKKIQTL
jgi:uncharacterized membrane protein YuzA (DUF378 family)